VSIDKQKYIAIEILKTIHFALTIDLY